MTVIPLTLHRANEIVAQWHRHNKPARGCRFCLGAEHDGALVGVVIVGRPVARKLDAAHVAEVNRLCTIDGAPKNTCSFLYGAARRVWFSMGGTRMVTYTLRSESGASLRGAGWSPEPVEPKGASGWHSREREHQPVFDQLKIRWEAPAA